jgi:hypothetical protein
MLDPEKHAQAFLAMRDDVRIITWGGEDTTFLGKHGALDG